MSSSVFLLVLCIGIVSQTAAAWTTMEKLANDITKDYLPYIDPGTDTKLKAAVTYLCADYDEKTHELTSKVIEYFTWKDERLTWVPSRYSGIDTVRIPAKNLWTPDFILYNSVDHVQRRSDVNAIVSSDGTVLWIPPAEFRTRCSPSGRSITCKLTYGSWTYDAINVPLEKYETGFYSDLYVADTCPYNITNPTSEIVTKYYPSSSEPWATLEASFEIQRRR